MYSIANDADTTSSFTRISSIEFNRKVKWKITLIMTVLEYGYDLLYIDADVILLKNPFPYLMNIQNETFITQRDTRVCSGFMYIRSDEKTIGFMRYANYFAQNASQWRDQTIINYCLGQYPIRYYLLPDNLFPSGKVFFEKYQYYWEWNSGNNTTC